MVPPALWRHLGTQFAIAAPDLASLRALYRRAPTLIEHQQLACEVLGFRWLSEPQRRALARALRQELTRTRDRQRLLGLYLEDAGPLCRNAVLEHFAARHRGIASGRMGMTALMTRHQRDPLADATAGLPRRATVDDSGRHSDASYRRMPRDTSGRCVASCRADSALRLGECLIEAVCESSIGNLAYCRGLGSHREFASPGGFPSGHPNPSIEQAARRAVERTGPRDPRPILLRHISSDRQDAGGHPQPQRPVLRRRR
jgi:hypothetical protein